MTGHLFIHSFKYKTIEYQLGIICWCVEDVHMQTCVLCLGDFVIIIPA